MTRPILSDSLCRPGRELHAAIPGSADAAGAREALKAFSAHAVACQTCYPAVANVGGLVSLWGTLHPLRSPKP